MTTRCNVIAARRMFLFAVLAATNFTGTGYGQFSYTPYVDTVGNSASYYDSNLPGYGIAQGSLMVLFGWPLGPDRLLQSSGFPLPLDLGGTSIKVTVNGVARNAPMVYTSAGQVAAILPSSTPAGRGTLVLTYKGQASYPVPINVVASAFGIYSLMSSGYGAGIVTTPDYQVKTLADSFHPNDSAILWGTGIGAISGDDGAAAPPAKNFAGTEVYVGNQPATVLYAGRSGCCAGLDQINFVVPAGVEGCFVPVAVRIAGVTSNFVSMPVAAGGSCSEPVGVPAALLRSAQSGKPLNVAAVALGSISVLQSVGFPYSQTLADSLSATLRLKVTQQQVSDMLIAAAPQRQKMIIDLVKKSTPKAAERLRRLRAVARLAKGFDQQGSAAALGQLTSLGRVLNGYAQLLPPPGSCSVYSESVGERDSWFSQRKGFDAGPELVLSGPLGTRSLARVAKGEYQTSFGGGFGAGQLPAGTYTVSAIGGADVGQFTASVAITGDLRWTNKAAMSVVDRGTPLDVTWSGGPATGYVVFGGSSGASGRLYRVFACVEDARKGRLTVPAFVLGALPATRFGKLFLGPHPFQNPFPAKGLDAAYMADLSTDNREVDFR